MKLKVVVYDENGVLGYYTLPYDVNGVIWNGETLKCYQCDLNGKNRKRIKEKTFNEYQEKYWGISDILN